MLKIRPQSARSADSNKNNDDLLPSRRTKTSVGVRRRHAEDESSSRRSSQSSTNTNPRNNTHTAWGEGHSQVTTSGHGQLLKTLIDVGESAYEEQMHGAESVAKQPWSVTELPDESTEGRLSAVDESPYGNESPPRVSHTAGDDSSRVGDDSSSQVGDDSSSAAEQSAIPTWQSHVQGPQYDSDDYDTDLEDDFPPEPEPQTDATGRWIYEKQCQEQGYIPVSYLLRNLTEDNTNLRMKHHYLGGAATRPLAEALKENTVCEEIDLSDNYIEGQGAQELANMLKQNMFVVNMDISHNFIKSQGAEAFAEMLETNTTLKTLTLKGNQLTDEDAKLFGEALKSNMSLNCLDLSYNHFGDLGGMHLGQGLALNIGLADLDLSWNAIRQKGAVSIAKALQKNTSLEILDLSWNGMARDGTISLATALKTNTTLKVLDISNNRLDTLAAKRLGLALAKNTGLETLLLGMNPIREDGVAAILKGIEQNQRLKLVGMEGCTDICLCPALLCKIKDLQESRDIMIMYTTGSPHLSKLNQTVLAVFDRFITENVDRMEDLFNQMDKDHSGDITLEEFKYGLKDFGLRLTSKQLDMLLETLDADKSGTIEFSELIDGSAMVDREKQRIARQEKEQQLYKEAGLNEVGKG